MQTTCTDCNGGVTNASNRASTLFIRFNPKQEKKKSAQADWKQNRPQKLKFTYKEQREFETIDDDIAALEELLEKLDKDMEANATNSVKLREIMEQKEKAQADLDEKMDRWVYLNDLAERIEAQKSEK